MANKMYLLVEGDRCHTDAISKMMKKLVDRLECERPKDKRICLHETAMAQILRDPPDPFDEKTEKPCCPEVIHVKSRSPERCCKIRKQPKCETSDVKAAITAEACIDACGRAKAKISVKTNQGEQEESFTIEPCSREEKRTCCSADFSSRRRNGLDPTFAEIRGVPKFEYLPRKSQIQDYGSGKARCGKPTYLTDSISNASTESKILCRSTRPQAPVIRGLKECVTRFIPEARLTKYKTCITRRDGLQDRCDPVTRNALRSCCKSKSARC